MMSRILVVVVLFSQLGLSDAYAGRFDQLGRNLTKAAGVAGAVGLGYFGYQTYKTPNFEPSAGKGGSSPLQITPSEVKEFNLVEFCAKQEEDTLNAISKARSELKLATGQDFSYDEWALKRLLENVSELKSIYSANERRTVDSPCGSVPCIGQFLRITRLFRELEKSEQFNDNLKAANSQENTNINLDLDRE